MRKIDIQQRIWLAGEYAERHHVDRQAAFAAVNDVQRRGQRSPHYDKVMAPAHERMDQIKAVLAPIIDHTRNQWAAVKTIMGPLVEWSQTEEGRHQIAQWKHEREEEARLQSCDCLCQVVHGSLNVCTGEATRSLVRDTETLGRVEIPVCGACAHSTLEPQSATA